MSTKRSKWKTALLWCAWKLQEMAKNYEPNAWRAGHDKGHEVGRKVSTVPMDKRLWRLPSSWRIRGQVTSSTLYVGLTLGNSFSTFASWTIFRTSARIGKQPCGGVGSAD